MYHKICRPTCHTELESLLTLAELTIGFGLVHTATPVEHFAGIVPPQALLVDELDPNLLNSLGGLVFLAHTRHEFVTTFEQRHLGAAGLWLWDNRPVKIAALVVKLLARPIHEKQGLLALFQSETQIEQLFKAGGNVSLTHQTLPSPSESALGLVAAILRNFYADVLAHTKGIPGDVIGSAVDLNRQTVLTAFITANAELMVCAGCDGVPPSIADIVVHADIDHFFPQSRYPFLAIHMLNLTPYCKDCNQTYKQAKDVLAPGKNQVRTLNEIYHPYLRPAYDEVKVTIERDPNTRRPRLRLHPKKSDLLSRKRLSTLNYMLKLESRWQGLLNSQKFDRQVYLLVGSIIRSALQELRSTPPEPSDEWLNAKLRLLVIELKTRIRSAEWAVPIAAYGEWILHDPEERNRWKQIIAGYYKVSVSAITS